MAQGSGGYGGPNFAQIEGQLRNVAVQFAAIASLQQQIAASIQTWRLLERELTLANAAAEGTRREFHAMEEAARRFALSSTYSASQVANSFYSLASAGMSVTETLQAANGVLLLAQATLQDLGEASDVVSASLSQFNLQSSESYRISNLFVASTNASLATLPKLAFALRQVGPIAAQSGLSIEQTTAALDKLFDAGLRGEQAGTALRNALVRIMNPVGNGGTILRNLGIEQFDQLTGQARPFLDIMKELANLNLSSTNIVQIFGTEAAAGATALMRSLRTEIGSTTTEYERHLRAITGTDAAYRMAVQQMTTLDGSLSLLQNNFNDFRIQLGQAMAPTIVSLAETFAELTESFKNLTTEEKLAYLQIGLMLVGFGLMVGATTKLIGGIGAAAAGFNQFNRAAAGGATGMSVFANRARAATAIVGGFASGLLGLAAGVAVVWGLVAAWQAAERAADRARAKNVTGNVLDAEADRRKMSAADRSTFTDVNSGEYAKNFMERAGLVANRSTPNPQTGQGAYETFRMQTAAIKEGRQLADEMMKQLQYLREDGKRAQEQMNQTGEVIADVFGGRFFGIRNNVSTFMAEQGGIAEARKQVDELVAMEGKNQAQIRFAINQMVARRRQQVSDMQAAGVLTGAVANSFREELDKMEKIAEASNGAVVQFGKNAAKTGREMQEQLTELTNDQQARGFSNDLQNKLVENISTNMIMSPEQFQTMLSNMTANRNSVVRQVNSLSAERAKLGDDIARELVNFVQQSANLTPEQMAEIQKFLTSPEGAAAMNRATAVVTQKNGELRGAAEVLVNELIKGKVSAAEVLKKGVEDWRAIDLLSRQQIDAAIRDEKIKYEELGRDLARLAGNTDEMERAGKEAIRLTGERTRSGVAGDFVDKLKAKDEESTKAAVDRLFNRLGGEESAMVYIQRQLAEVAGGNKAAGEALVSTIEQEFRNDVKNVDALVEQFGLTYRNALRSTTLEFGRLEEELDREREQALREQERKRAEQTRKYHDLLEALIGLPTSEEIYLAMQEIRQEIASSFNSYYGIAAAEIRDEMNAQELELRQRMLDLQDEYSQMFTDDLAKGLDNVINNRDIMDAFNGRAIQRIRAQGSGTVLGREFTAAMLNSVEGQTEFINHVTNAFTQAVNEAEGSYGAAERTEAFGRMMRNLFEQMGWEFDRAAAALAIARDKAQRLLVEQQEFQEEFDAEKLMRDFQNMVVLTNGATNRRELEIAMDIAIRAKTSRIILDAENAKKELREKYEQLFHNLGIAVTLDPSTGRLVRATGSQGVGRSLEYLRQVSTGGGAGAGSVPPEVTRVAAQAASTAARAATLEIRPVLQRMFVGGDNFAQHVARGSTGVDLRASVGTSVFAPFRGRVTVSQSEKGGMQMFITSDDGRVKMGLAHLSTYGVAPGSRVEAGQRIATTGRSGGVDPHLHANLRIDGRAVDPMKFFGNTLALGARGGQPMNNEGLRSTAEGLEAVRRSGEAVNEMTDHSIQLTEEQKAKQEAAFIALMAQYNQEMDTIDKVAAKYTDFITDTKNQAAIAMAMVAEERMRIYAETQGLVDSFLKDDAEARHRMASARTQSMLDGMDGGGDSIAAVRAAQASEEIARLRVEQQERINQLHADGARLGEDTSEIERQINEYYQERIDLIGLNIDTQREFWRQEAEGLMKLAHRDGDQGNDPLLGLRAAVLDFAATVPTVFETMRETALTALNGIAEVGAGLLSGTEKNAKQAVANILRAMSQLLLKMVVMWAMIQLIRALPGGTALLSAMDMASGATPRASGGVGGGTPGIVGPPGDAMGGIGYYTKMFAQGGTMAFSDAEWLTKGQRRQGGIRQPKMPAISVHGEGDLPEAYIPMVDKRTVQVRIDDNGRAYIPLPSGMAIPVSLGGGGVRRARGFAGGGIGGWNPVAARRADSVGWDSAEGVGLHRRGPGSNLPPNMRVETHNSFKVDVAINGNASASDADAIANEIARKVDALMTQRESESARNRARNRDSIGAQYGIFN